MSLFTVILEKAIRELKAPWSPVEIASFTDYIVYLALFEGEYPKGFHSHEYDELFFVHQGEITIQIKDGEDIVLKEGELGVVPKGVLHCPKSKGKSFVLMFEPNKAE